MRLAVALAALAGSVSCGSFYDSDGTDPGRDGGGGADARGSATDARGSDAAIPTGDALSPPCTPAFTSRSSMAVAGGTPTFFAAGSAFDIWYESSVIVMGTPTASTTAFQTNQGLANPRLSPDGVHMLVEMDGQVFEAIDTGSRTSPWCVLGLQSGIAGTPGATTLDRSRLVADQGNNVFIEYVRQGSGSAWTPLDAPISLDELGMSSMRDVTLSPDGLRIVFAGVEATGTSAELWFADRASPTDTFGRARLLYAASLEHPEKSVTPFLSATCDELFWTDDASLYRVTN